jgi:putative PIN family toxin of toxin-antitoxin system
MRIILDTNVLLSAFIRVNSRPYKLLRAWFDGRYELVSSPAQIEEITRVARYAKVRRYIAPAQIGWLVNRLRERALLVERLPKVDIAADPADNFLLGMAKAGKADYLVTGDKADVLAIGRHAGTHIVTVIEMVRTLRLG